MEIDNVAQALHSIRRDGLRRMANAFALQRDADDIGFLHLPAADAGHEGSGLGADIDQPFIFNTFDGLTHRRPRRPETLGNLYFIDRRTGREPAGHDGAANELIDLVAKRHVPRDGHAIEKPGQIGFVLQGMARIRLLF